MSIAQCLELTLLEPPDVVIGAIGLPDGSGSEMLRHLRDSRDIRGVTLSGWLWPQQLAGSSKNTLANLC